MNATLKKFAFALLASLATGLAAHAEEAAPAVDDSKSGARAMAVQVEAEVTEIDLETRHVSLRGPDGNVFTVAAPELVIKLEDVKLGDKLVATYIAALEAEVRAPTAEELAEPWLVLEDGAVSADTASPGVGTARRIRAVCTIEGMNRELGTVTIKDPRGKLHLIGDVEPEKMSGVTLGQTIVMVFTEALALNLEHVPAAE